MAEDMVTVVKEGEVDYDKIADARVIEYNGQTYSFHVTSRIRHALFIKTGVPVLLMDKDFDDDDD